MAKRIKRIIVHWSVTPPHTTVDTIRQIHVNKNGWRDVGYHRIILHPMGATDQDNKVPTKPSDLIKRGRDLDDDMFISLNEIAAAAIGFNDDSVMVCVVGDTKYPFHPMQKEALRLTLDIFTKRFGLTKDKVFCHRDVNPTKCPGDQIYNFVKEYKSLKNRLPFIKK